MTSKKHSLLLVFLFVIGALTAGGNDPILIKSSATDEGLSVTLANLEGMKTTVRLKSLTTHAVIHRETVRAHNGYAYLFDLDALDYGRYYLEITKGDVVKRQVLVVGEHGVLLGTIN